MTSYFEPLVDFVGVPTGFAWEVRYNIDVR
jgi:hypothetical protein